MMKIGLIVFGFLLGTGIASGNRLHGRVFAFFSSDSTTVYRSRDTVKKMPVSQKLYDKVMALLEDGEEKKNNVLFFFGPHYSSDAKLGLGVVAAGSYYLDNPDSGLQPSNISLYTDITTKGYFMAGIGGNNIFPKDRYRINYDVYFYSYPAYYWGIGYDNASKEENKTKFKWHQTHVQAEVLIRLVHRIYVGTSLITDYVSGKDFETDKLADIGQRHSIFNFAPGIMLVWDTRDIMTNAYKGVYFKIHNNYYSGLWGNKYIFMKTDIVLDVFRKVWRDCILALDFHHQANSGNVPWTLMAMAGGSYRMRGYYEGRYRDRNIVEMQMELRQKIYRRHGVCMWIGGGNVYENVDSFRWKNTLPNFGLGYRFEIKKRTNLRLDYGFGKGQTAFIFQINEAF